MEGVQYKPDQHAILALFERVSELRLEIETLPSQLQAWDLPATTSDSKKVVDRAQDYAAQCAVAAATELANIQQFLRDMLGVAPSTRSSSQARTY